MSLIAPRNHSNNRPPMSNNDDRDENFLIDALGTWIPECELIFYGLLGDPKYRNELYKLRNFTQGKPRDVYLDTCFFQSRDLIRYLASSNLDYEDLDDDYVQRAANTALHQYLYAPCSETAMRHAIMELMYQRNMKSVTLVFPWQPRPMDMAYLKRIIPPSIISKFNVTGGTIPEVIASNEQIYTTIIINDIDMLRTLVSESDKYRTKSTLFLLRNHSGNMDVHQVSDDSKLGYHLEFVECDTSDIMAKMVDPKTNIPISQMRFGRFEPKLFQDVENQINPFRNN